MTRWTTEADALLRTLVLQPGTATQIARQLSAQGAFVTRCAVMGRCRRLDLTLPGSPSVHDTIHPRPKRQYTMRQRRSRSAPAPAPVHKHRERLHFSEQPAKPTISDCTIAKLTTDSCRWPLWGDRTPSVEKRYCGAHTVKRPYCREHTLRSGRFYSQPIEEPSASLVTKAVPVKA